MAVSFRSVTEEIAEGSTVKANVMVQIATNKALKTEAPKYNKKKFDSEEDAMKVAEYFAFLLFNKQQIRDL